MKPDHPRGTESKSHDEKFSAYRWGLVTLIDGLSIMVANAPVEMEMPRESIQGLLMAAYHLLDVKPGVLSETDDPYFMKSAIQDLKKALGPLGLGVDYWDKINAWRRRDLKEGGDVNFLTVE